LYVIWCCSSVGKEFIFYCLVIKREEEEEEEEEEAEAEAEAEE